MFTTGCIWLSIYVWLYIYYNGINEDDVHDGESCSYSNSSLDDNDNIYDYENVNTNWEESKQKRKRRLQVSWHFNNNGTNIKEISGKGKYVHKYKTAIKRIS